MFNNCWLMNEFDMPTRIQEEGTLERRDVRILNNEKIKGGTPMFPLEKENRDYATVRNRKLLNISKIFNNN